MIKQPLRRDEGRWVPDVHPRAVKRHAEQAAGSDSAIPKQIKREGSAGAILEQARLRERDAGEDKGRRVATDTPQNAALGVEREVAGTRVAEAGGDRAPAASGVSMRASSQAANKRSRLALSRSIQTESELWTRKDRASSNGSALRTPPPVSSRRPRSSEMVMAGLMAGSKVGDDLLGAMVDVDDSARDAGLRNAIEHMVDQRLALQAAQGAWAARCSADACAVRARQRAPLPIAVASSCRVGPPVGRRGYHAAGTAVRTACGK